jgi:hypothetical protein
MTRWRGWSRDVPGIAEIRHDALRIARLARHIRRLRARGRLTDADAEVRSFQCGGVVAVPSGVWRAWMELADELERLSVQE